MPCTRCHSCWLASGSGLAGERYERPLEDPALVRLSSVHGLFSNASIIAYSVATLSLLRRYRARLLDHFAAIERLSLDWLRNVAGVILALGVTVAVVNLLRLLGGWTVDPNRLINAPVSILVFYGVAIMGFRQSQVLLGTRLLQERQAVVPGEMTGVAAESAPAAQALADAPAPVADVDAPRQKGGAVTSARYQRSGLNEYRAERLWQRLQELMQRERLHLQPELHLGILAERLGVRQQTLSEVLNEHAGLRFYDFVNGLRVEEAKKLLADPAQARLSVLDIALMAGFSSKSTFNKYFALSVGSTPSEFRRARQPV